MKIKTKDRVRLCADIPPELMQRVNDAFDKSHHKTRAKFVAEILEAYLSTL